MNNIVYIIIYNKYNKYNKNNKYIIHKNGFILNLSTGHIHSTKLKNNYLNVGIKKIKLDNLIFCIFNNITYSNKIYLKHIDQNYLNNNLNNLEIMENKKNVEYKNKTYIPLKYIILYKKYNMNYNLITVYTNHKFINEYSYLEKNKFIINLLNYGTLIDKNNIWKIEIITINPNESFNYNYIENTSYRISLDNTHILDCLNNIIKYKVDSNNKQYIDILDNTQKIIKIYYEYKYSIDYNKDYFKDFNNIIKKEDLFHNYNYEIDKMLFEKY